MLSKPRRGSTPVSFIKKLRKSSSVQSVGVDTPTHPRAIGRLLELKPDGTQTVELTRPPHGPFGIYIARATAQYNYSVFVTRFSDGHPEKLFAGLLNVGDEILEINDSSVKNLSLDEVYNLMGSTDTMVLRTVPVWCREKYTAQ
ncbi:rho GTPase-activating protein syd-1-like [Liolophura sinensis]|uniref:rho GTPase-activating protein syd-1-like n=1 Tax=Liolophura sinensis TaxID=3198878 RepID=UPI0031594AC9